MFSAFKNLMKRASEAIFGKPEEKLPEIENNSELGNDHQGTAEAELDLAYVEAEASRARQEKLKRYAEQFMTEHNIKPLATNGIAIERFLVSVQGTNQDELHMALETALRKAEETVNESKQVRDRLYNQRFASLDMRHSISIAYLSLRLKLVTSISNAKLKGYAAIEKAMERKNLLEIMSKVFWLRFTYFEIVDSMIRQSIAERVNTALEEERRSTAVEYRKYRQVCYEKLHRIMEVDDILASVGFEPVAYKVKDVNLDRAYVGVFSVLGTIGSVAWKFLLVFLFIFGMPITSMVTIIMNPDWINYITPDRSPYVLAFASFMSCFFVGALIVLAVRLFIWKPAVVNSFQQKYRILNSGLNVYVDSYWQPKVDAIEEQYNSLDRMMEQYFADERAKISGLDEVQLAAQIEEAKLLMQFFKGMKI